jgi:hypothetical protein
MTIKTTSEVGRFVRRHWCVAAVGLALTLGPTALRGEVHLDVLKTRTDSFTNVTVYSRSQTDIFIRHSRGIANVKLENLNPETIARLNSGDAPGGTATPAKPSVATKESPTPSNASNTTASISYSKLNKQMRQQMMSGVAALSALSAVRVSPAVVAMVLGALLAAYLFVCYCLKLICQKTGNEPGVLIWLPVLQMFPLLRAAGMSGWWFVGFLIPAVNLVAQIIWCFKIVQARGKSVWAAIGLLLPVTNLVALLYLAFSGGNDGEPAGNRRVAVGGAPLPAEA